MKRNSLTTALLAGLAGAAGIAATANAVNVNPDGVGGALIYPYYTVNKGNTTLLSVVNTTSQTKAVKVRFLEGRNSREVLDFNLYLSPFDVWVGAVTSTNAADANSGGVLSSPDRSCTVPQIPGSPQPGAPAGSGFPFVTFAFDGSAGNALVDHNVAQLPRYSTLERTREGYAEIIEMGVVGGSQAGFATHNSAGFPANCPALLAAWSAGGTWAASNGAANVSLPTGGLYGSASIVNAPEGVMYSYDAVALEGFYTNSAAGAAAALHTDPGSVFPQLGAADSGGGVATSIAIVNNGQTTITDNWAPVSAPLGAAGGWNAVSAALMHEAVFNEYLTAPALGATSEWVLNFPTKRHYVDRPAPALRPFSNIFFGTAANPGACERFEISVWDREEQTRTGQVGTSPPGPSPFPVFCYESQVFAINQNLTAITPGFRSETANLGARFAENVFAGQNPPASLFTAGHVRLRFNQPSQVLNNTVSGRNYLGLPVIGFWTVRAINGNLGGVLANYSGTYSHKYERRITQGTQP
jgi:hypothetical protein